MTDTPNTDMYLHSDFFGKFGKVEAGGLQWSTQTEPSSFPSSLEFEFVRVRVRFFGKVRVRGKSEFVFSGDQRVRRTGPKQTRLV